MENKNEYAQIVRAVLIDDRRIELYWSSQMHRADCEQDFTVRYKGEVQNLVHWTSDMEWGYGTVYQKESMRTTLSLTEPIDIAGASDMDVQVTGNLSDVMDRPVDKNRICRVVYEPYYSKYEKGESGLTVKAGKSVHPNTMKMSAAILDLMVEQIPDVRDELLRRGAEVAVFGLKENAYDIPEHRMGYLLATRHVAGYGGEMENPMSSVSEANVIRLRSGRYATMYPHEMILVHEFGHAIHLVGINGLTDRTRARQIEDAYSHAVENGLWSDTYAISNYEEYFATMSTIWFNVMQEGIDGQWDGIRGPVNTREELKQYDIEGYKLMQSVYPEKSLPAPWNYNRDAYGIDGRPKTYDIGIKFDWDFIK